MLKRRAWPAYTASVVAAMLTGAALIGPPGASAARRAARARLRATSWCRSARRPGFRRGPGSPARRAGSASLRITVALRSADPRGLRRLATRVSTPGSAGFRHFLIPRQVQARFGPHRGAAAAVRAWLNRQHLTPGCWGMAC